eukprot:178492-Chlamydomonas_euryale.AAC.1
MWGPWSQWGCGAGSVECGAGAMWGQCRREGAMAMKGTPSADCLLGAATATGVCFKSCCSCLWRRTEMHALHC